MDDREYPVLINEGFYQQDLLIRAFPGRDRVVPAFRVGSKIRRIPEEARLIQ